MNFIAKKKRLYPKGRRADCRRVSDYLYRTMAYGFLAMVAALLISLMAGCASQNVKGLAARSAIDSVIAHEENPTDTTARLVVETEALSGYLGKPVKMPALEEIPGLVDAVNNETNFISRAVAWAEEKSGLPVGGLLGWIGFIAAGLFSGGLTLKIRAAISAIKVLTSAIEPYQGAKTFVAGGALPAAKKIIDAVLSSLGLLAKSKQK